jgi:hypothetical protein
MGLANRQLLLFIPLLLLGQLALLRLLSLLRLPLLLFLPSGCTTRGCRLVLGRTWDCNVNWLQCWQLWPLPHDCLYKAAAACWRG